ncbi:MAG: DUF429 domain-containing protein, partial [Anaerolineae bacterium]|nr:DUF429 domain-containing protein [Anaerolineae bacterium]
KRPSAPITSDVYRPDLLRPAGSSVRPLVLSNAACVLPMQPAAMHLPWVVEACPAVLLKRRGLYIPYKGRQPEHRAARQHILGTLQADLQVALDHTAVILHDVEGDALDSVLAALAATQAAQGALHWKDVEVIYQVEGLVLG